MFFAYIPTASNKTDVKFKFKDLTLEYDGVRTDYNCMKYADEGKTELLSIDTSEADIAQFIADSILPS